MAEERRRPDPDELLSRIEDAHEKPAKAALKIFLGMSAGVGKTYAMLQEARSARAQGLDIVLGLVETHGRSDTDAALAGLELFPRRRVEYKGIVLEELDVDGLIARAPAIAVIDELAHENAPGSRHVKRWQDVEELLEKGISIWTAVNIQHLESYSDVVEELTFAPVHERVPDTVFDRADEIRLIDIAPEDLIRRLEEGRVYTGDSSRAALEHFFTPMNLGALREISLRYATRAASRRLTAYAREDRASAANPADAPSDASLGERILVAVGSAPNSAHLVRWARRTAYALRADWMALNVETGAPMKDPDRRRLEENLELARRLGAEVVVTRANDVPSAVVETARARGATLIVVGRSGLRGLGAPRRSSISERIMREAAPIDIALVQDSSEAPRERLLAWFRSAFGAPPREYALLGASFALLVGLGELAAPFLGYRGLSLLFLAAVLGLSLVASPAPVAALAIVSALALNFFFIPPLYTLSIGQPEDWILFAVYFLVAFVTSTLVSRLRSRESLLRERESAASFLFDASRSLAESRSEAEALAAALRLAESRFCARAIILVDDGEGRLSRPPAAAGASEASLPDREFDAASYAYAERKVCGSRTATLPSALYHYVPASSGEETVGVIGIALPQDAVWKRSDDELLQSLGRSLALALLRRRSDERSRDASLRLESERLGGILLDSVSHELRTPLTAITGALSALADEGLAAKPETRRALVATALGEADELNAVVEDLLSLSRIESGILRLKRSWVDLSELASSAVERAGRELAGRALAIDASEDCAAFVDAALVARLAANLLRNAARYSPADAPIDLALELRRAPPAPGGGEDGGEALALRVRDRGPGLPEDELDSVFAKFARGRGAKGKGLGLGLAICKGLAEAHGGGIVARNAPGGGLEIETILPFGGGDGI